MWLDEPSVQYIMWRSESNICILFNILELLRPVRIFFIFISQVVGAIAAAGIVEGLLPGSEILFAVQLNGTSMA
jgi:hypothetical protein